jgi:hypothetical protein
MKFDPIKKNSTLQIASSSKGSLSAICRFQQHHTGCICKVYNDNISEYNSITEPLSSKSRFIESKSEDKPGTIEVVRTLQCLGCFKKKLCDRSNYHLAIKIFSRSDKMGA